MDFKAKRKSKAPWQLSQPRRQNQPNPYAENDTSFNFQEEPDESLAVPKNAASRKQNRRLSIHSSAAPQYGGYEAMHLPPLPGSAMHRTVTNNSDMVSARSHHGREENIVDTIKNELRHNDATAIDDFYKSLVGQKNSVDKDIKNKIDENQKNIIELTENLQVAQQELLSLRISTKELYSILDEFTDAAERRLELEISEPSAEQNNLSPVRAKSKKRDRSSVIVLQKMWAAELQSLYKHVDGAQKYVQAGPDRHILAESGRWYEINVGTWKASEAIHIFLLNDLLLIATRKHTQEGSTKRLQATHCWPLHAVELSQMAHPHKNGDSDMYLINIRSNSLSFVYQTDRYDHLMRVMNAYQRGKSELARKQRLLEEEETKTRMSDMGHHRNGSQSSITEEGSEKRQLRDSYRNSGLFDKAGSPSEDPKHSRNSGSLRNSADILLKDISVRVHSRNRSHDFMKSSPSGRDWKDPAQLFIELKTNEDKLDEVDVHLAHNEYMNAVGLIKHIENKLMNVFAKISSFKRTDAQADELRLLVDVVKLKINSRKSKVQQGLSFELNHNIASLTVEQTANIIEFYMNFDKLEEGLNALREALSAQLARTLDKLIFNTHGSTKVDIVNYLSNLIIVHVQIIKRAVTIHKNCVEPIVKRSGGKVVDSSGFVTWSVSEMEQLSELIKKHASGSFLIEDNEVWKVKDAKYYEDLVYVLNSQLRLLKKEGLNVDYLFDDILHCVPLNG